MTFLTSTEHHESTGESICADAPESAVKPLTVGALAMETIVEFGNDIPSAASALLRRMKKELPDEYREHKDAAMTYWAQSRLGEARRALREQIVQADDGPSQESRGRDNGSESLKAFALSWMNWPLMSGVILRNATRPQVLESAAVYARDAETFGKRGQWLAAIAKAMPDDTATVSQTLSESAVAKKAAEFGVSQVRRSA